MSNKDMCAVCGRDAEGSYRRRTDSKRARACKIHLLMAESIGCDVQRDQSSVSDTQESNQ